MDLQLLLSLGMAVAFVFVLTRMIVRNVRRQKTEAQRPALSGVSVTAESASTGAGTVDGTPYRYEFSDRGNASAFSVIVTGRANPPFLVRRETSYDQVAKSLGMNAERQKGDGAFDAEFYLEPEGADSARRFELTATQREAVRGMFAAGASTLRHDGTALTAEWAGADGADGIEPRTVEGRSGRCGRSLTSRSIPRCHRI